MVHIMVRIYGGPADFPWVKALTLACTAMSESVCSTVLYPMVPFMVRDFGTAEEDVGYIAGILASSYNIAQIPSNLFWGRMSDLFGRRRILLIGLSGQALGMLCFGFATSVPMALAARCLCGLLTGNSGVARATMKEVTTKAQQAQGMSLFGAAWGIGFFLGPLVGGALSKPAESLPLLRGTVLDQYPDDGQILKASRHFLLAISTGLQITV